MARKAEIKRKTNETDIAVTVNLDGTGAYDIATGIGFLDHMLDQLSKHSLIDISVRAKGDLHIDFHHTAEDVGINVADMIEVRRSTQYVAGLPNSAGDVGGDPGPHTALGVFLGIKAAVKRALGKDNLDGLHIAMQGAGSVATGVAMHACAEGARLSIADVDQAKAKKLADATNGQVVSTDDVLGMEADVVSPNALGAILNERTIAGLKAPIVAGAANNQLATPQDGARLHARDILYAPDYVINAGGIINVCTEYLADGDANLVRERIQGIPVRLEQVWSESAASGRDPAAVADAMAQKLIGRG